MRAEYGGNQKGMGVIKAIGLVILTIVLFGGGYYVGKRGTSTDTLTLTKVKVDTLYKYSFIPIHRYVTDTIRVRDTLLIRERKVYQDSTYRAVISGIDATMDSLQVYRPTITIDHYIKPKRWNIGVQAGYGLTPKGLQPYIGVGIGVRF